MSWLLFSETKQDIFTKVLLFTYSLVEGWPVCGRCVERTPFGAGPPGEGFFPCLDTSASKSSEAALFFPHGEEALASPFLLSSMGGVAISLVWMRSA